MAIKDLDIYSYKRWYSGVFKYKNIVGIIIDKGFSRLIVEVKRVNDYIMVISLGIGGILMNVISVYVSEGGLEEEVKKFWDD